jgi:hypothetical protein
VATSLQVTQFRTANQQLVQLARTDLNLFWAALNVDGNPLLVKAALLDFFPELMSVYSDTAAILGADFYDSLRDVPPSASAFRAIIAAPTDPEIAAAGARWALGPLFQTEPDAGQVLANLSNVAQRLVLQAGRDTIANSTFRDPVRTGYARVPTGASTCKFCVMLASRGAVFGSAASAGAEGNTYHGDCDCVPTPVRSRSDLPDGYDPKEFERLFQLGSGVGRDIPTD